MSKRDRISDEAGVAARDKELKNVEASLDLALRDIMESAEGRYWIWNLLSLCRMFATPMTDEDRWTAFRCGEQNVGLQVMQQVHRVCPELYAQAMNEAKLRE